MSTFWTLSFWHSVFYLCFSSGLNFRASVLLHVVTSASPAQNLADKGPVNIHLCSQFHSGDSLLVTDVLGELVPLLFLESSLLGFHSVPSFFSWCFLTLCIDTLGKWWFWAIRGRRHRAENTSIKPESAGRGFFARVCKVQFLIKPSKAEVCIPSIFHARSTIRHLQMKKKLSLACSKKCR